MVLPWFYYGSTLVLLWFGHSLPDQRSYGLESSSDRQRGLSQCSLAVRRVGASDAIDSAVSNSRRRHREAFGAAERHRPHRRAARDNPPGGHEPAATAGSS